MNISELEFQHMKEYIVRDMAFFLTQDFNIEMEDSLRVVYDSRTFELLCNPDSGFYYQSPRYVYNYLKEEFTKGKFNPNPGH